MPNRIGDRTLEGGEKGKNKTRGNGEGRKGKIGGGVSLPLEWALVWNRTGTANSGAVG